MIPPPKDAPKPWPAGTWPWVKDEVHDTYVFAAPAEGRWVLTDTSLSHNDFWHQRAESA